MVVTLARMKLALMRHNSLVRRFVGLAAGVAGISAFIAFILNAPSQSVSSDIIVLALTGLLMGWVMGPMMSPKAGILSAHDFILLPLKRSHLGMGLLAVCFVGLGPIVAAGGLAVVAWWAVGLGAQTLIVAIPAAILVLILVVTASRFAYALLGSAMQNRLGVEITALQYGFLLSLMFVSWMLFQMAGNTVATLANEGIPGTLTRTILDWVPTSWAVSAIEEAAAGNWGAAVVWLGALFAITGALVLATVYLLVPKSQTNTASFTQRRQRPLARFLPKTALGAVISKEIRQWSRDPWRVLEIRTSWWAGIFSGAIAWIAGFPEAAAFAAVITAYMTTLIAANLYGHDGTAIWQLAATPDNRSIRADVVGRALALLVKSTPVVAILAVVFIVATGQSWAWPYVVALSIVFTFSASGIAVFLSVIGASPGVDPHRRIGPNDTGDVQFQVWMGLWMVPVAALPTGVSLLVFGILGLPWLAVLVAVINGVLVAWLFVVMTYFRLRARLPETFARIRYGKEIAAASAPAVSILDRWERSAIESNTQVKVGS